MPCYYYCEPSPPLVPVEMPRPTSNLPNRLQYTVRQRWLLNEIYRYVPYPNSVQKNVIADRVGASREQIRKFLPSSPNETIEFSSRLGIWFQNRRRLAVQGHRTNALPLDHSHAVQSELEEILVDLDAHKNAPQRMPIGQGTSASRRARSQRK